MIQHKTMTQRLAVSVGFGLGLMATLPAAALDFDYSGTIPDDNTVLQIPFTVTGPANAAVTFFTSSWVSGGDANDPPLPDPIGFDPIFTLWTASGNLLESQDDAGFEGTETSNGVSYFFGLWDIYHSTVLAPGQYIAVITQYDNFPVGNTLAGGFRYDGDPNFTFTEDYGPNPKFNGTYDDDDPRTGYYEFHITMSPVGVPDAGSSGALLMLGLGGLWGCRRRRS